MGCEAAPTSKENIVITQWRNSAWHTVSNHKHGVHVFTAPEELGQNMSTICELESYSKPCECPLRSSSEVAEKLGYAKESSQAR